MKLLVIGGTRFSGRFCVEAALSRGHSLTLVHRGNSLEPDGLPEAEHLVGDRGDGPILEALAGRSFDAVLDFAAQLPADVAALYDTLGDVGHATVVSSVSVYAEVRRPGIDESQPVVSPASHDVTEINWATYASRKVACEQAVQAAGEARGMGVHIVRPGLIVGPRDPTGRFTWWPLRLAAGGVTVAPLPRTQLVQGVDARDLATFLLAGAESGLTGLHNAVGRPLPLAELIGLCRELSDDPAMVRWADGAWLEAQGVSPWMELPLWLGTDPDVAGHNAIAGAAGWEAGLRVRPIAETVRDVLAWARAEDLDPYDLGAGLSREQEARLLAELG